MRRLSLCLSMLIAGSMFCHTMAGNTSYLSKIKRQHLQQVGVAPGTKISSSAKTSAAFAFKKAKGVKYALSGDSPSVTAEGNKMGFLTGPDGNQWYYLQEIEYERKDGGGGYYYNGYITASTVRVYNSDSELMGTINVDVDATLQCNNVEPYGYVTSSFFDSDASTYEVAVGMHCLANTDAVFRTQAYSLSTGKKVWEKDGQSNGVFTFLGGAGSSYQRLCFLREGTETVDGQQTAMNYYDVMKPASEDASGQPTVEHSFRANTSLQEYIQGAPFYAYEVNGKMDFVVAHYEKTYISGDPDIDEDITVTADNKFVVEVYEYDESSKTYNYVDSIAVPIETPTDVLYRTVGIGLMSTQDVSYDYYVRGARGYVIDFNDYVSSDDTSYESFVVYDSQGNAVKTLCTDVCESMYFKLNKLALEQDQMAFLCLNGSEQGIKVVYIPSGEQETMIPAKIGNDVITVYFDRAIVGDDYQYVMKLQYGDMDAEGNLTGVIGWYTRDLTLDHKVYFNLGKNGETFTPAISSTTLNPYLFNTDEGYEYVYLAQKDVNGDGVLQYVLEVADSEGNVIRSFTGTDDLTISDNSDIVSFGPGNNKLMVVYSKSGDSSDLSSTSSTNYKIEFYDLPFSKFNGGDGTAANPYLIATAGDLNQIRCEPNANYKLANDFSMEQMGYDWVPINEFGGSLDGDGHTISDFLYYGDADNVGLFGALTSGSTVKNLTMTKVMVGTLSNEPSNAGVVAGKADGATIDNVHVYGYNFVVNGSTTTTGGIVGTAANNSKIGSSSFDGSIYALADTVSTAKIGGIVGNATTGTTITATSADVAINCGNIVGGIAGEVSDATVCDSHADAKISAGTFVGGVVGSLTGETGRGAVKRSYAEGSISSEAAAPTIGGVVGNMKSAVTATKDVDGCLSNMTITTAASDGDVNHIVGNAAMEENGIGNCYTLATATINGVADSGTDAASAAGQTIDLGNVDQTMLAGIGYAYGSDANSPWMGAKGLPILYFEDRANSVGFTDKSLPISVGEKEVLYVTIYGGSIENLEVTSSNSSIASVVITKYGVDAVEIVVTKIAAGTAIITASIDGKTATCAVTDKVTAISDVVAEGKSLAISVGGGTVKASGATQLTVYGISGQTVASVKGDSLGTNALVGGVYIAVAKDANGNTATKKFVVR